MKKLFTILMILALVCSFEACTKVAENKEVATTETPEAKPDTVAVSVDTVLTDAKPADSMSCPAPK